MLAVLEVTQRVPPTCITKPDFTYIRQPVPTPHHRRQRDLATHHRRRRRRRRRRHLVWLTKGGSIAGVSQEAINGQGTLLSTRLFHLVALFIHFLHFLLDNTAAIIVQQPEKLKKGLVLIILAIVFKHNINIKKYMFV
jgi:hypothetical protein